jgi:LmbE family N-acetylglucosaminyl deacetylase
MRLVKKPPQKSKEFALSIVFLSPHYDDAVYSCGGTIYQFVQQGEKVIILTLMGGLPSFPLPDTPIVRELQERWAIAEENPVTERRREDDAAAKILGAIPIRLNIPDCIYRQHEGKALYPDDASLWAEVHPQDPAHAVLAKQELEDASLIYAPLGAGRHVDHQLVREWALKLQAQGRHILFYEDYPYLRKREAVDEALTHFKPMQPYKVLLSEAAMQAKIAAMAAYSSQISSFWENAEAIDAEVRQTFADAQGYAERGWGKQT